MITKMQKQTIQLTMVNGLVRLLGLGMRIVFTRLLGAEIIGITELANSVHMMAITPLTSGLPLAVSRLTAKEKRSTQKAPLYAAIKLVKWVSFLWIPLFVLLTPLLSKISGDVRVFPSLLLTAPCILVLGYSATLNGYCYAVGKAMIPAASEFLE